MVIPTAAVCTMTWITVIWSINAGATLTLAAFCGAVRSKQRENRWDLLFSCSAAAAAVISAFELWMMRAWTVEQYQLLLRWIMRYRAQTIGSSCEVHACPTQGTIVHCRVPLEAQHSISTIS